MWALFLIGGGERWVDVEDAYLKMFELAPARFSWRTRPDLPDYKKCAKTLFELEMPDSPLREFVSKKSKHQRKLTMPGVRWCEHHNDTLTEKYGSSVVPSPPSNTGSRRLRDIVRSQPYIDWTDSGQMGSQTWELLELLRCLPDASAEIWGARCDELEVAARRDGRQDLEHFINQVRATLTHGAHDD